MYNSENSIQRKSFLCCSDTNVDFPSRFIHINLKVRNGSKTNINRAQQNKERPKFIQWIHVIFYLETWAVWGTIRKSLFIDILTSKNTGRDSRQHIVY